MIKANMKGDDGVNHIMFALSHANLDKLKADGLQGHIAIDLEPLGVPGVVVYITAGESEEAIQKAMAPLITNKTIIHDMRKKKH